MIRLHYGPNYFDLSEPMEEVLKRLTERRVAALAHVPGAAPAATFDLASGGSVVVTIDPGIPIAVETVPESDARSRSVPVQVRR